MNGKFDLGQVIKHLSAILVISSCDILECVLMVSSLNPLDAVNFGFEPVNQILVMVHFIAQNIHYLIPFLGLFLEHGLS